MTIKKIFTILILFFLVACIETKQQGFYFGDNIEKVKNFDVYNFKKKDLINNFGYPSLELPDGSWLYYSYITKNLKIFKPKLYNEKILLVNFNKNNEIISHTYRELKNKKIIDNTDINSKNEDTFFNTLFKGSIITPIK